MKLYRYLFISLVAVACGVAIGADVTVVPMSDPAARVAPPEKPSATPEQASIARPTASTSAPSDAVKLPAASSPPSAQAEAATARTEQWHEVLEQLLPNSPEEIREYRRRSIEEEKASAPRAAPKDALSQAIPVSLQPGGKSPRLKILHGFVMALEVLDSSGQPWPITDARLGDKDAYDVKIAGSESGAAVATEGDRNAAASAPSGVVQRGDHGQGNIVTISAIKRFQPSNLILILQGESRPISIVLLPAEATESAELEDRVTLLVDGNGPLARPQAVASYDRLDIGDDLRRALVGAEPKDGATEVLATLPPGMRAWTDHATLWLRTPEQVISPAPQAAVSMGNMRAYRLPYLPTVVLLDNGHLTSVSLRPAADKGEQR